MSPPEGSAEHGHRVCNVRRRATDCARRPARHGASRQLFQEFDDEKAVRLWLPPRDSNPDMLIQSQPRFGVNLRIN
jgi:hypothetical protein